MIQARLIACTEPQIADIPSSEALLAFCARVSATGNQLKHETGPKLIQSLIQRREWSPLEMIHCVVEITTTRSISRQILRHKSFSFQEFSQRYAKVGPTWRRWMTHARLQDHKDRQNSLIPDLQIRENMQLEDFWRETQEEIGELTYRRYEEALARGIAKEEARNLLPEGMTQSHLYMAGSLRSWIFYMAVRAEKKSQLTHRRVAAQAWDCITPKFPTLAAMQGLHMDIDRGNIDFNPYLEIEG